LVGANGRWYDVAAVAAVPEGAVRRFTAGAVDGYLLNEKGRVWALSAICTHMGCHINWAEAHGRFECLCHSATFDRYGAPRAGLPLAALPHIYVRVTSGRIYVWGTQAMSWG
jgi:Rieske Fe-S protein